MSTRAPLSRVRLAAYACGAFPLALLSLPVYVHVPKFYGEEFGIDLAALGVLLFALRLLDAVQDPWLGHLNDVARARGVPRLAWLWLATPLLVAGAFALFAPRRDTDHPVAWLLGASAVTYLALSVAQIGYHAHGAELTADSAARTRVTAWREVATLGGILVGASLPAWLARAGDARAGFAMFAWIAGGATLAANLVAVRFSPSRVAVPAAPPAPGPWTRVYTLGWHHAEFRRMLFVYICNGTAAAVPATLVLFYVQDVLAAPELAPAFLVTYFAAGAFGMPCWPWLAARYGKSATWLGAMLATIAVFGAAATLGPGDAPAFFAICALSGVLLGADLALPPALLADLIAGDLPRSGGFFGVWAFVTKLNLGLAAGLALPLLALFGYTPRVTDGAATQVLAWTYAGLPCALKACAAALLWRSARASPHPRATARVSHGAGR